MKKSERKVDIPTACAVLDSIADALKVSEEMEVPSFNEKTLQIEMTKLSAEDRLLLLRKSLEEIAKELYKLLDENGDVN